MAFRYAVRRVKIYGRGLLPFHILRCYESKSLYHKDCKITENEMMKMNSIAKKISPFISIVLLMLLAIGAAAEDDADVNVRVNAPEYVSDTFEVTIDITNVSDMDGGQFDLIFDYNVIDVIDVGDVKSKYGNIDDTEIPVDMCNAMDDGRIRLNAGAFPRRGGLSAGPGPRERGHRRRRRRKGAELQSGRPGNRRTRASPQPSLRSRASCSACASTFESEYST